MRSAYKNFAILVLVLLQWPLMVSAADASDTKQNGELFLAENLTKEGVQVTASGLQYIVLREGAGDSPSAEDSVKVNYKGTHISGDEFDNSSEISFPLNGVIRGWTEGLQLMKQGAQYRFFIPAVLAYGERGAGGVIKPNEALIFDVELLEIN